MHLYSDERITVVSPALRDERELRDTTVTAEYGLDVVSGATQALTIDAVSAATRFSERRHQGGLTASKELSPETEVEVGYTVSAEPDHVVHSPSLGVTRELLSRMVRASARYQLLAESIGLTGSHAFSEHALGHRLDLGWTQIFTRSLVVTALATATAYDCSARLGCFANPYRYVGVDLGGERVALPERAPARRLTGAAALRLSRAFADSSALHAGYRLSGDSWDVQAHTVDLAVVTEQLASRLLVRAEARATLQRGASFYSSHYQSGGDGVPGYRTADAELSQLRNLRLQLHLEWSAGRARFVGELGRMWNSYPDFPTLPTRHAWLGGLGLDLEL
ncbi:MAG: DUF3570 domain-containing protein [Deltaproteobacteria bacterium]|nr:DUF3570 domain-containing protein [Deltaproteobacteria bacterium]